MDCSMYTHTGAVEYGFVLFYAACTYIIHLPYRICYFVVCKKLREREETKEGKSNRKKKVGTGGKKRKREKIRKT